MTDISRTASPGVGSETFYKNEDFFRPGTNPVRNAIGPRRPGGEARAENLSVGAGGLDDGHQQNGADRRWFLDPMGATERPSSP
jgi:hypothetical protein